YPSYFFFQAEDGIRDRNVTGVQTCALPIYLFIALLKLPQRIGVVRGKSIEAVVRVIGHKELLIRHYDISVVALEELIDLAVVPRGVGREFISALTVAVGIGIGTINRGLVFRRDFLHVKNSCQRGNDCDHRGEVFAGAILLVEMSKTQNTSGSHD